MKGLKTGLTLLILLLSQICSGFSKIDTLPRNVVLNPTEAIGTIKDLIRYDGCKEIVKVMEGQILDLKKMNDQKDTIIKFHENNAIDFRGIISNDKVIMTAKDQKYDDLNRRYKRSVRWGRFKVVLLPVFAAAGAYVGYKLLK